MTRRPRHAPSLAQVKAEIAAFYAQIGSVDLDDEPEDTMGVLLQAREDERRGIEIRDADVRNRGER